MGTWDCGINSNDTAQDLKSEYQAAFYYNDVETALEKIDRYIREEMFDESDEEEWCNYIYSLADYMWKKGILTNEIRDKAVSMIDSGFGLDIWRESGEKTLLRRTAVLKTFKLKLLSPQPPKKKISISLYTKPVFEVGDIITMQLRTASKPYAIHADSRKKMDSETFGSYEGKYMLIQKVRDDISYTSSIEPNVRDIWPVFRLFDVVYDEAPESVDISALKNAVFTPYSGSTPLFSTDGSMRRFKQRNAVVLGNDKTGLEAFDGMESDMIFLSVQSEYWDFDSMILAAISS